MHEIVLLKYDFMLFLYRFFGKVVLESVKYSV